MCSTEYGCVVRSLCIEKRREFPGKHTNAEFMMLSSSLHAFGHSRTLSPRGRQENHDDAGLVCKRLLLALLVLAERRQSRVGDLAPALGDRDKLLAQFKSPGRDGLTRATQALSLTREHIQNQRCCLFFKIRHLFRVACFSRFDPRTRGAGKRMTQ